MWNPSGSSSNILIMLTRSVGFSLSFLESIVDDILWQENMMGDCIHRRAL